MKRRCAFLAPRPRSTILPLASILTPNSFEAGLLTGLPVRNEAEALAACDALHALGPHTVVGMRARASVPGCVLGCPAPRVGLATEQRPLALHCSFRSPPDRPACAFPANPPQVITSLDSASTGDGSQPASSSREQDGDPPANSPLRPLPGAYISLVASTRQEQLPGRPSAFRIRIPKLDAYFTGTGGWLYSLFLCGPRAQMVLPEWGGMPLRD